MADSATSSQPGDSQVLESKLLMHRVTRMDATTFNANPMSFLMSGVKSVVESPTSAQSNPDGAVILSKDLKSTHGDRIKIDMLHKLRDLPVMGERMVEGKEEGLMRSQFSLRIEQTRKPVYGGSRKAQQMRGYPLRKAARMALDEWWKDYYSELFFYHLAGCRGKYYESDIIVPALEPTFDASGMPVDEYSEIYVNPLQPPTFDRHFYAGTATAIGELTVTDTMDLETLKRVGVAMQTMPNPPGAIRLANGDKPVNTDPIHVGMLTPEQYKDVEDSDPTFFYQAVGNARERVKGFNHELFRNDCFMVENVLWKKYHRPIRHYADDVVTVSNNDKTATTTTVQVPNSVPQVDSAMILGKQALALALAGDTKGIIFSTDEEEYDLNDKHRTAMRWMGGLAKVRQYDRNNKAYDVGVIRIDTASTAVQ